MDQATHNKIVSFIWGIADDVLRDLFRRGKYPDVILPMCVIRRMDAVLEPTKPAVLDTKKMLDEAGITEQRAALCDAAGQAFYNTSKFTLRDLKSRASQQQLLADFEDYLNGFSQNVQDILENFKFRNQLTTLSRSDSLGTLIAKFLDPDIDLSPAGIDNHSMGTVFEELVRKFNEDNNEEAGEHWTPRDAVRLMANLVFLPIQDRIKSGTYMLYDCACGTGGMLTVAEDTLTQLAAKRGQQVKSLLYGQEINPETYAVCKADMLLKGEGENAEHIVGGAEWSTLAHDAFPAQEFDFMLANPPYGKSWKKDLEAMGGKDGMRDPRFKVMHQGEQLSLVTRSSDGQMLFLANMAAKMNGKSALGSRIAEVHNGSSLFTGDAGQGESNIRRWIIENDWLEAIVALPLNLFYNTGIATYIWVLTNRKPEHRKGQVQLIDASQWFKPLRKNLGKKNCELSPEDIERITHTFLEFKETAESKIFPNKGFGYWKVTVERPLRLHSRLTPQAIETLRYTSGDEDIRAVLFEEFGDALTIRFSSIEAALEKRLTEWGNEDDDGEDEDGGSKQGLPEKKRKKLLDPKTWARDTRLVDFANVLREALGGELYEDHNIFRDRVDAVLKKTKEKISAADLRLILKSVSWREETAPPVIAKLHKPGKLAADPLRGLYLLPSPTGRGVGGEGARSENIVVEHEPDSDLRDTEQVPLLEEGGIEAFIRREVLPYTPDAWINEDATKIGYEVSFTRHFYKPKPLRSLEEISADILAIEKEAEGLLDGLLVRSTAA
ncbi:MAG: methylase [Hydrocarboniphaga sp.]|uniref:type I restriction-modification system subunit M n=1 Tax=Hydrocarboniphaga sp. TaxID=2033016 RepID=UPI00262D0A40|nr:class I SAM-dependent DNA methyltransferase [Hydrocarboniphaga sp.]MDB5972604.1 methylase [Hydrocarboniphaga sp.]